MEGLSKKFPMLRDLDLRGNKIFSVDTITDFLKCRKLTSLNLDKNPCMTHPNIVDAVTERISQLEVVNGVRVRETGSKYLKRIDTLK